MNDVRIIVALLPSGLGHATALRFNRELIENDIQPSADPIVFEGDNANSMPHMSLFHGWFSPSQIPKLLEAGRETARAIASANKWPINLAMEYVAPWRDVWVFWLPAQPWIQRNDAFLTAHSLVLDGRGGVGGLPRLRSKNDDPGENPSHAEQASYEKYGYGFTYIGIMHMTLGLLAKKDIDMPGTILRGYYDDGPGTQQIVTFDRMAICEAGPNGTIKRILESYPIAA